MKAQFQISYRQRLIAFLLSFLSGEALPFLLPTIYPVISIITLFCISFAASKYISLRITGICIAFLLLGNICSMYTITGNQNLSQSAKVLVAKNVTRNELAGTITTLPVYDGNKYTFVISTKENLSPPFIQIKAFSSKEIALGDKVTVKGSLEFPKNNEDSTFDYINYLTKDKIFLLMQNASILKHTPRTHLDLFQHIMEYNHFLQYKIKNLWDGDIGALIAGILIGSRESMSQDLKSAFQRTGLSHIVAISGSNITIIIIFIFGILGFLPKMIRVVTAISLIILFTILVGASSAVVRASIMGIIGLCALLFERKSTAIISLLVSAVIMCIINPMTLLYDIGFALSFLAVLGLLYGEILFKKILSFVPKAFAIRESLLMTLSAQVFTVPIMLYYFQSFSIIAPLANILITPWIPLLMLLSFIALLCSFFSFLAPFTFFFAKASEILTSFLIHLTHLLSEIPYASINTDALQSPWTCIFVYILIGISLFSLHRRSESVKK